MADRYEERHHRERFSGEGERLREHRGRGERGLLDRAQDEVRSWLGDAEAGRRRRMDVRGGDAAYREDRARADDSGATLGTTYDYDPRGARRSEPYDRGERGRVWRGADPDEWASGSERPQYDPSGAAYRGWNEPNYGYRPAAGYGYGEDSVAEPGWEHRSISGYAVGWRGVLHGPFAGRGPAAYQRADSRVLEDVSDRLADAPDVDASDIEVQVSNGEVTLSGTVSDRPQKRRAEDVVEHVPGVREVHNRLRVAAVR